MTDLSFRRVAEGREPVLDVVRLRDPAPPVAWRSRGALAGRFALTDEAGRLLLAAVDATGGAPPPEVPSPPAGRVVEQLSLDGVRLTVPAGARLDGPWGELLAACRSAVDRPGDPVAAVALIAELPGRVRLEHRGSGSLELGFGALHAVVRWTEHGLETGYADGRLEDGVMVAGPGWSLALDVHRVSETQPHGEATASATFAIRDAGVWIPVVLELRVSA